MTDQYAALYASYQWLVPSQFNIAQACVHRWAENAHEGRRIALHVEDEFGQSTTWTYQQISETANQLANGLIKMGAQAGDHIVIAMGQHAEFVSALTAVLDVGAVAIPLPPSMSLAQRLHCIRDAQARIALVDAANGPELLQASPASLTQVVGLGFAHDDIIPWRTLLARQPTDFKPRPLRSDAPALLLYTSQTDAMPTGQLFSHSALIGSLPGFVCAQNWFPQGGDTLWTSLDWASPPGLLAALLPSLYFGRPCVSTQDTASAWRSYELLERYRVTNLFLDAPALAALQEAEPVPNSRFRLALRGIALHVSPDAPLPDTSWCERELGIKPNALFSLPQAHCVIGQSHGKWPNQAGSIGRPYPGHLATVQDPNGLPCAAGVIGELILNRYDVQGHPDPAWHLWAWHKAHAQAAQAPAAAERLRTGLPAYMDKQGDIWLVNANSASGG